MGLRLLDYSFRYKTVHGRDKKTGELVTRHYPYVPAVISSGPNRAPPIEGLLDSGSDGIVIPLFLAKSLNLELEKSEPMKVVGRMVDRFRSKATVTLGRAGRFCEPLKDIPVNIPLEGDFPIIFGRAPIFELFRITFVEAERRFTMEPYSTEVYMGRCKGH
jgi:hypothetical protein